MAAGDWKSMLQGIHDGDLSKVRYFLEQGVDPNYEHPEMLCTPLIEAIRTGKLEMVQLLLEYGADPYHKSPFEDMDAFAAAKRFKNDEILRSLKKRKSRSSWFRRFFFS